MEIIKQGKPPEEKQYRVECRNCESVIGFKRKEAEAVFDPRDGDYLKIVCPVCKATITKAV
jgi:hypothetical protein